MEIYQEVFSQKFGKYTHQSPLYWIWLFWYDAKMAPKGY